MPTPTYTIRNAQPAEFNQIGELMVRVYSQLEGFPKEHEQPNYYKTLLNIGDFIHKPGTELLVAVSPDQTIVGGVLFFNNMQHYGSGGTATTEKNAAGFRLLAVDPQVQGKGIGKLLTQACIQKTKAQQLPQLIIHSTKAMQTAWKMYEAIGFRRSEDLDFKQGELEVFGFRLEISNIERGISNVE
jgi:GNAT superfamily N-acetyltransferase